MIGIDLILQAVKAPISSSSCWRLLVGTAAMLAIGYTGGSDALNAWIGFFFGVCGWAFILPDIFGRDSAGSFNNMRIIVSMDWSIYHFLGQVNRTAGAAQALNVTYTIADFVNKVGFVLACWSWAEAGTKSTVPLHMIEFHLILQAVKAPFSSSSF